KCFAKPLADAIASHASADHHTLADVGAGSPYVATACQQAMPQLTNIKLVDRENGMKYVREMLSDDLDRFELCSQDFFQAIPAADIYNISNTAHDWSESEYIEIMSNVRKSMSPNSFVCIHEPLLIDEWYNEKEWCDALWMACYAVTLFRLTQGKGSCYSIDEHDAIQQQVGLSRIGPPIPTIDGCTALFYAVESD
ncbi:MAG: hypothetical protein KDB27_17085, partial [Planctomycetales bacterium]|nr:hypothetical protein [Planctomycetales bacterium]